MINRKSEQIVARSLLIDFIFLPNVFESCLILLGFRNYFFSIHSDETSLEPNQRSEITRRFWMKPPFRLVFEISGHTINDS